jgi:hypothetical protein
MTAPDQAFYDFEFTHSKTGHPHIIMLNKCTLRGGGWRWSALSSSTNTFSYRLSAFSAPSLDDFDMIGSRFRAEQVFRTKPATGLLYDFCSFDRVGSGNFAS